MATERVVCKLSLRRKAWRILGGVASALLLLYVGSMQVDQLHAQSTPANLAQDISDTWQGTLHVGKDLRVVVKISKMDTGAYKAVLYSIDQGGVSLPTNSMTVQGTTVKFAITALAASYEGKLSPDGKSIVGTFTQGAPLPLTLARATPETAWTIPEPPPQLPPMAANASPTFEVATIKPSKPDTPGKRIGFNGRDFKAMNLALRDLIVFAYDINDKQLIGAPAWVEAEKYDLVAKSDGEGAPSMEQWKIMIQKMLADRFKLQFHPDKKELSVYVLSVGKAGAKLTKSEADPNGVPSLLFRALGDLMVHNSTVGNFSSMILQGQVLDRPVLDRTGISGKYDFTLKWTPDESQFSSWGIKFPPPPDNAPPPLYTAIQEQLGLRLDATKAPADVLVIDHVEKPSAN